jgi:hypothetical protein
LFCAPLPIETAGCVAGQSAMCLELLLPHNHTALTGDLEVQLIGPPPERSRLQLLRATAARSFAAVAAVPVQNGSSWARFPCGVLTLGGRYRVALLTEVGERAGRAACGQSAVAPCHTVCLCLQNQAAETVAQDLDVRWPVARLALRPERAQTYPEVPVNAFLEFSPTTCSAAAGAVIPELWLELWYCGHSPTGCADNNTQVLLTVVFCNASRQFVFRWHGTCGPPCRSCSRSRCSATRGAVKSRWSASCSGLRDTMCWPCAPSCRL